MPRPIVLQNSADEKSQVAYRRVKEAMRDWESEVLQARLSKAGLPSTLSSPVNAVEVDMARPDDMAANLWSKLFPAMLVMMGVTGAFYPAIDLGAGREGAGDDRDPADFARDPLGDPGRQIPDGPPVQRHDRPAQPGQHGADGQVHHVALRGEPLRRGGGHLAPPGGFDRLGRRDVAPAVQPVQLR